MRAPGPILHSTYILHGRQNCCLQSASIVLGSCLAHAIFCMHAGQQWRHGRGQQLHCIDEAARKRGLQLSGLHTLPGCGCMPGRGLPSMHVQAPAQRFRLLLWDHTQRLHVRLRHSWQSLSRMLPEPRVSGAISSARHSIVCAHDHCSAGLLRLRQTRDDRCSAGLRKPL